MKDKRAPVIADVCYGMQCFLLLFSLCVFIAFWSMQEPYGFCMRLLPTALAYIAAALAARLTDSRIILIAVQLAAVAGCLFSGTSTAEYILLGIMALGAVACGITIRRRTRSEGTDYTEMFVWSVLPAALAIIATRVGWTGAAWWINAAAAVYLPLCIASWYVSRAEYALAVFNGRTAQPIEHIRRRTNSTALTTVMLVLLLSLLLPQANGDSLIVTIGTVGLGLFMLIINLMDSCVSACFPYERPTFNLPQSSYDSDQQAITGHIPEELTGSKPSRAEELIFVSVAALVLIVIAVWAVITLVKAALRMYGSFLDVRGTDEEERRMSRYDTVEKLDRREVIRESGALGRSNADRVRRRYKKRVTAILGDRLRDIEASSPDEIAALCLEQGEDISALTAVYKKARYTQNCTAEDVRAARKL